LYQTVCDGALTEKPEDATVHPGGSLRLSCRSNVTSDTGAPTPVLWLFTKEGSSTSQEMTSGGGLKPSFADSFTIDSSNKYDLVATETDDPASYCGTYECIDKNGAGERASAAVAS